MMAVFFPRCMECQRGLATRKVSLRLSVCQTRGLWQVVQMFIPYERSFSLVLWVEEWLPGGDSSTIPSTWNFGPTGPRWSEIADFEPIFTRSASAVTPSEKSSINTDRKSTTRFPMSLRWSYVAHRPPKGGWGVQKRKTAVFRIKSYFAWRKSATKYLCVKTVSDRVVGHSLA